MAELIDLATTAAGNTARFPENMQFRQVNDAARELEAMLARNLRDTNMSLSASGSSNAFAVTTNQTITAYYDGMLVGWTANHTITGAATLNVNGLGAKAITAQDGSTLARNDIAANQKLQTVYRTSTGSFQIVGGRVAGSSADILARIVKAGSIQAWPTATIPTGWLECDGSAVSRTTYSELFAAISTTYGAGDGSTTFNLPDYRGVFLRGHANGSPNDPDRASRTNRGDGTTGDNVGTAQADATRSHSHTGTYSGTTSSVGAHAHSESQAQGSISVQLPTNSNTTSVFNANSTVSTTTNGVHLHSATVSGTSDATGGNETRPINKAVKWIILANPAAASASGLGLAGFAYTWDSGTTDADPGTGKLRWNHATTASATAIYVSETDGYNSPLGAVLQSLPVNTRVHIFKVGDPGTYAQWSMGATATDAGVYDKLTSLTYIGGNGTFANGDSIAVVPFFAGATGSTGAAGSDGGIRWTFDSSTTMADPGTGEFRTNNATNASITALAFSALTGETGNPDFSDWLTTWDDSTTTSDRGQITLRNAAGTAQVVLSVTGAVTDNSTWLEVPVAHVASTGTLTGTVYVSFSRTGNAGAGSGDVSAGSNFGTDNRVLRSDGTLKGAQASAVTIDDSGNVSGVGTLAMSGALTVDEVAAPSTPASGKVAVYAKSDGKLYIKDDAGTETDLTSSGGSGSATPAECRLDYVSTTEIKLNQSRGKYLFINGASEPVPSAGVSLANTGLTASTGYFIYAYMNAGTMTLEASTTAPNDDSTYGHKIKTGDSTRSLVGRVHMNTGTPGVFADSATKRWVISYHNRIDAAVSVTSASAYTTTVSPWAEIHSALRSEFLHWGDEQIVCATTIMIYHATANVAVYARIAFGTAVGTYATGTSCPFFGVSAGANYYSDVSTGGSYTPVAGFNAATLQGGRDSGTGNYASGYTGYTLMIKK